MSFLEFKTSCLSVLAQSQNCQESQSDFGSAANASELAQVMRKYINGVLHEVPNQVIDLLDIYYPIYRDQIRAADVYYNEPSASGSGIVIIGNTHEETDQPLVVESNMPNPVNVYVLGKASVLLRGHAHGYCDNPAARIELRDHATAIVLRGYAVARDRSRLTSYDRCECHNFSSVIVNDNKLVHDFGHYSLLTPFAEGTNT